MLNLVVRRETARLLKVNITTLRINWAPGPDLNTKILNYSSIGHIGWISIAITRGENLWTFCFVIYSELVLTVLTAITLSIVSFVNQILITNKAATVIKFIIFTQLLSVRGLPPFLGFLPKWLVIPIILTNKLTPTGRVIVITSLFTLYYYLKRGTWWHSWLRHCATSGKVASSIPDGVTGMFRWHNLSGCTVALGLMQSLTEMSIRNISWRVKAAGA
jgi:formate hydrogenlyase subunit 3/multisubunit Na+/H+ antiporter MnhD subunit